MSLITLTTDYGKDHFVASLKGVLLKHNPKTAIIDISHQINPYDTLMASYIVKSCYQDFPEGSVHIVAVDASTTSDEPHIAVYADRHFFICPNKGFISQVFRADQIQSAVYINAASDDYQSFQAKTILSKAAIHLSSGGPIELLGNKADSIFEIKTQSVYFDQVNNKLIGHFIYIDHYGNLVTNIKRIDFDAHAEKIEISILYSDRYEFLRFTTPMRSLIGYTKEQMTQAVRFLRYLILLVISKLACTNQTRAQEEVPLLYLL